MGNRVIVDVDDVLIDFVPALCFQYNLDWEDDLTPEQITDWDLTKFIKPEAVHHIHEYFNKPGIYPRAQGVPMALEGLRDLRYLGLSAILVTASENPEQRDYLIRYGYYNTSDGYVQSKRKDIFAAQYLIDDKPETVAAFPGRALLFDRPWNRDFEWKHRVKSWPEAVELIGRFEHEAQTAIIPGIGPDAPTEVGENGGKQSRLDYAFELFDPLVLFNQAAILAEGAAKYGSWNWRGVPIEKNLRHALAHIYAWLAGDSSDDHLGHAACRLHFAKSLELTPGRSPRMAPED